MRNIILNMVWVICLSNCSVKINPELKALDGVWRLNKITYGFPGPNSPTFTTDVPNQYYYFDAKNSVYTLTIDNIIKEKGEFKIESQDSNRPSIVFITKNEYATYTIDKTKLELVLYQRTQIGAILADGSFYHYEKILKE